MAPFIVIVVCYGILVYSLEIQYYIYSWLSITIIFISLNSTSNKQQPHIKMMLNNFLCSIYSKRLKNVESIVFLIVFCLVFLFLLGCVTSLVARYLLKLIRCSLLVAQVALCKKSLTILCKIPSLLVAKNNLLLIAKFACYSLRSCSLQKSTCYSLQK